MRVSVSIITIITLSFVCHPAFAQREYGFDNTKPSGQPYLKPEDSVARMKVANGFEVKVFAAEPDVINPIAFTIDERGRIWVVECYEYPSRTPPGKAPRDRILILEDVNGDGKCDKRTVFAEGKDFPVMKERADKGLGAFDLASGIEVGHGGVFLGAPPYLWFIENKDDKPGRFEVLLKGFGSQDTHETLNTFQWGPDGWLYGLHGVFTYSDVQTSDGSGPPVRMNAAVWRYYPPYPPLRKGGHEIVPLPLPKGGQSNDAPPVAKGGHEIVPLPLPKGGQSNDAPPVAKGGQEDGPPPMAEGGGREQTPPPNKGGHEPAPPPLNKGGEGGGKFEIFAEGTSNPWGMDFDSKGNCFLCCCVIPHLFHVVPGGIYVRQAGSSFNPYAYGYIKEICDHTFHKESGWAHAGLLCLDNENVPEEYRTSVIFGSIHGCSIKRNVLKRNGSTFVASKAEDFLVSGDKNFRPINMRWGPNGDIYLIDWHDQNPCHQAKPESWDKERGRVYRIQRKNAVLGKAEDLGKATTNTLVAKLIGQDNPWVHRTALRLLHERQPKVAEVTAANLFATLGVETRPAATRALAAIQALHLKLEPPNPRGERLPGDGILADLKSGHLQAARIRYVVEQGIVVDPGQWLMLVREGSPEVRRELLSVCLRLQDAEAIPLLHALSRHKEDALDPVIPLTYWYAYEKQLSRLTGEALAKELRWLKDGATGNPLITNHVVNFTMRRLVAKGEPAVLAMAVRFAADVSDPTVRRNALAGLVEGLKGRQVEAPPGWDEVHAVLANDSDAEVKRLAEQLAINFKSGQAVLRALKTLNARDADRVQRLDAIQALGLAKPMEGLPPLIDAFKVEKDEELRRAAARALGQYEQAEVADVMLRNWKDLPASVRHECANALKGRRDWAMRLLDAVGSGRVERTDLNDNVILAIRGFNDRRLNELIERYWGRYRPSPKELEALIEEMKAFVTAKAGDAAMGKLVFQKHCQQCHKFDGQGHDVGPALDGADRSLDYLVVNVLDPNRVIGQPYYQRVILLKSGQLKTGLLHAEDDQTITLKRDNAALEVIVKEEIEETKIVEKSLMPEGLDKNLTKEDFRHLVEYLRRK